MGCCQGHLGIFHVLIVRGQQQNHLLFLRFRKNGVLPFHCEISRKGEGVALLIHRRIRFNGIEEEAGAAAVGCLDLTAELMVQHDGRAAVCPQHLVALQLAEITLELVETAVRRVVIAVRTGNVDLISRLERRAVGQDLLGSRPVNGELVLLYANVVVPDINDSFLRILGGQNRRGIGAVIIEGMPRHSEDHIVGKAGIGLLVDGEMKPAHIALAGLEYGIPRHLGLSVKLAVRIQLVPAGAAARALHTGIDIVVILLLVTFTRGSADKALGIQIFLILGTDRGHRSAVPVLSQTDTLIILRKVAGSDIDLTDDILRLIRRRLLHLSDEGRELLCAAVAVGADQLQGIIVSVCEAGHIPDIAVGAAVQGACVNVGAGVGRTDVRINGLPAIPADNFIVVCGNLAAAVHLVALSLLFCICTAALAKVVVLRRQRTVGIALLLRGLRIKLHIDGHHGGYLYGILCAVYRRRLPEGQRLLIRALRLLTAGHIKVRDAVVHGIHCIPDPQQEAAAVIDACVIQMIREFE